MRAFNKIILFGIVLLSLIFTYSSFPHLTDTNAMLTDTKHVDATFKAAVWDTQDNLFGLYDLKLLVNNTTQKETNQGNGSTTAAAADSNSTGDNSFDLSSLANFLNNSSVPGNYTFNLTRQTANKQTADNQTTDNQTENRTNYNMGGGSFGPSGSDKPAVLPVANFSSNISSGYIPLSVQFTDLSENATMWSWDFGDYDTSTDQNAQHTYSSAGNYIVTLTARNSNGTSSTSTLISVLEKPIVIIPPVANFSSSSSSGLIPFSVQFTDLSENASEWNWDFGDGNTSTDRNPVHIYSSAEDYNVKLTVTNSAGTDSVTRKDYIKVRTASSVKLTSITLDGENSTGVTTNSGAFTTNIQDSMGQISIKNETGALLNQPNAKGSLGEVSIPLAIGINNFTLVADGVFLENKNYGIMLFLNGVTTPPQIAVYNSNGGNGEFSVQTAGTNVTGSANGGVLLDKAPGTFFYVTPDRTKVEIVSFVVDSRSGTTDEVSSENLGSNGVPDTIAKLSLRLTPSVTLPTAAFYTSMSSGKAPLKVSFTDTSTGFPTSWKWDFGDGNESHEQNPQYTYSGAGIYNVRLSASNGNGSNSTFSIITVTQPVLPVANFSSNVTSGSVPFSIQFTDLSKDATQWNWAFGDGNTSTEQNPVYVYYIAGDYSVTLTASNTVGKNKKVSLISVSQNPDNFGKENSLNNS